MSQFGSAQREPAGQGNTLNIILALPRSTDTYTVYILNNPLHPSYSEREQNRTWCVCKMRRGETSLQILAGAGARFYIQNVYKWAARAYQDPFLVISYNALSAVCVETSHKPQAKPMALGPHAPLGFISPELLFFLIHIHPSIQPLNGVQAKIKSPCSFGYNTEEIKEPT